MIHFLFKEVFVYRVDKKIIKKLLTFIIS